MTTPFKIVDTNVSNYNIHKYIIDKNKSGFYVPVIAQTLPITTPPGTFLPTPTSFNSGIALYSINNTENGKVKTVDFELDFKSLNVGGTHNGFIISLSLPPEFINNNNNDKYVTYGKMSWNKTPAPQTGLAELSPWTDFKKSTFTILNGTNYINFFMNGEQGGFAGIMNGTRFRGNLIIYEV